MYCVIQTKGVDEPWWMMDDWKEMIVLEESCSTLEEAKELYKQLQINMKRNVRNIFLAHFGMKMNVNIVSPVRIVCKSIMVY